MSETYELRRKLRGLPINDQGEVMRFRDYLRDKVRMPPDQFKTKWGEYELGNADGPTAGAQDE